MFGFVIKLDSLLQIDRRCWMPVKRKIRCLTLELGWKKLSGKREFKRNYKFDKERKKEGKGEWS